MARVLIVEGADRGLRLAQELIHDGHAVRMVAGASERRGEIEAVGAQCVVGSPDRLATLGEALEHVTIACWLLADAEGDLELVRALHGPRLRQFVCRAIDTTLRGFIYEAGGSVIPANLLTQGWRIVSETAARNSMPAAMLDADPSDLAAWLVQARALVDSLLEGREPAGEARYPVSHIPKSRSAFDDETSIQEDN